MKDAFSRCHPVLNFFYFAVVIGFTMFMQHPVFLLISFAAGTCYAGWLNGWVKTMKMQFLFTLPALLIVALLNPMFNHYGVTPLLYIESSGNWVTLEALVYGLVLGCVLFIVIGWFSCYNTVMTTDKFVYLFGRMIPALSLILSMVLRFVPHFQAQLRVIRNGQKCAGRDISNAGLIKKVKYGLNILSILITWSLENAIETADSMKSRGYGLHGRTAFSIYRFDRRDKVLSAVMMVLLGIFAVGCCQGAAFAQYDPRILIAGLVIQGHAPDIACPGWLAVLTFMAFAGFAFVPLILGITEEAAMRRCRDRAELEIAMTYRQIYEQIEREGAT